MDEDRGGVILLSFSSHLRPSVHRFHGAEEREEIFLPSSRLPSHPSVCFHLLEREAPWDREAARTREIGLDTLNERLGGERERGSKQNVTLLS